ncbi:STAS domain-containing protein [Mycobacterium branderi]|uniref:Anti-sigma factor antagonist n=1 Tax=Mycobacterium branderi TaxID=43348 RepID=A0A7I7W1M5_9MYCO|nr:STAS domain-containing protein [Mycobacterium branderi]MCV7236137.1 STAS domain-containing protein [Mycobacterium branderi]ORA32023.1 anti-anti-sigma factor [Mycobacterium branderi]BBZ10832.1 hypothetical protein MBRA_10270 [Mycobacterium branderi]
MDLLAVACDVLPEAVVVHVKGEVDSSNVGGLISELGAALRQAATHAARRLVIDLQALTYFGSAGLNAVLDCHRQGADAGTSVRLVADNVLVTRPIEVTNLHHVLQIFPTLTDALQDHGRG